MTGVKSLLSALVLWSASLCWGVTLEGIVEIREEDANYKPVEVNLMVDEEANGKLTTSYYWVYLDKGKGRELLDMTEDTVQVTGKVWTKSGKKRLTVLEYKNLSKQEKKETDEAVPESEGQEADMADYPIEE